MTQALTLSRPEDESRHPSTMSIRELIAALAATEDRLRQLPSLVVFRGRLVPNPERRLVVRHQRRVVGALRHRRAALRAAPTTTPVR